MIEEQYEAIMDLHGRWIDGALEAACDQVRKVLPNAGPWSSFELASRVRDQKNMPDGLSTIPSHHFLEIIERRLEILADIGRAKKCQAKRGWNTYEIMDILDALAAIQ